MGYAGEKTEDDILTWSQDFGTIMHAWCLEDIEPKKPTKLMKLCKKQFDKFLGKECPRKIFVEKKIVGKDEFGDAIYKGTCDYGVRIKGDIGIVELKFFACWKWWLKFRIPKSKLLDASKAAKANLQTKLYDKGQDEVKTDFWGILWITPDLYVFKKFSREPKKLEATLEYAQSLKNPSLNF